MNNDPTHVSNENRGINAPVKGSLLSSKRKDLKHHVGKLLYIEHDDIQGFGKLNSLVEQPMPYGPPRTIAKITLLGSGTKKEIPTFHTKFYSVIEGTNDPKTGGKRKRRCTRRRKTVKN